MKNFSVKFPGAGFTLTVICTLFLITSLYGQRQQHPSSEFIRNAKIQMSAYANSPTFIRFKEGNQPTAFIFFREYKKSFPQFSGSDNEARLLRTFEDNLGETHFRYNQYYKGIQVLGAQIILHEKNGFIRAANGYFVHGLNTDVNAALSESNALRIALDHIGAVKYMWESQTNEEFLKNEQNDRNATFYPQGDLMLTSGRKELLSENVKLVYRFDIYAEEPRRRDYVDVNAVTGEIVNVISRIHDADVPGSGTSSYNGLVNMTVDEVTAGTSYRLQEQTTRAAALETYDAQNGTDYGASVDFTSTSANGPWDAVGVSCHWGAEQTYDYFFNDHGRNSFDNTGGTIFSYAHFDVNYNNAFWDGTRMTYGDGDGTTFTPLVCLDVVGHEITHGVTENAANLVYQDEPGALNESFSDIFGTTVEFFAEGAGGDWAIGEDIYIPDPVNGIRQMANPNVTNQPDTYFGDFWAPLGGPDFGGVHTNSGVQNFWFYLATTGGSGTNDNGDPYNVTGIGMDDAAAISYRNLTVYLGVNSTYADARTGAIDAATDLFGAGSQEVQTVMDAWDAVGVYEPVPPEGVLVYEGELGVQDYSGAFMNNYLTGAGFTTQYTSVFPTTLIGYDAVFLSFGNFSGNYTEFTDPMAAALQAYLEAGGKCYLEGGDSFGFDQSTNTTIHSLFGLSAVSDGTTNIIDGLAGQPGAITNGMLFTSSTQVGNGFIDIYTPNTGIVAFNESSYGDVAVQNTGSAGQKTFCFSYALADLVDGASPSTKNELLSAIVNYLDIGSQVGPPDISVSPPSFTFNVPIGGSDNGTLTIFNTAPAGSQNLNWNITDQEAILELDNGETINLRINRNNIEKDWLDNFNIEEWRKKYKNISRLSDMSSNFTVRNPGDKGLLGDILDSFTAPGTPSPIGLTYDPGLDAVWISDELGAQIFLVEKTSPYSILQTLPVPPLTTLMQSNDIAVVGNTLYISDFQGDQAGFDDLILAVDKTTGALIDSWQLDGAGNPNPSDAIDQIVGLTVNGSGEFFASNNIDNIIRKIDLQPGGNWQTLQTYTSPTGGPTAGLDWDPQQSGFWVANLIGAPAFLTDINFSIINSFTEPGSLSTGITTLQNGILWMSDFGTNEVYVLEGLQAACPWLAANPGSGVIPSGGNQDVNVSVEATGLAAGTYDCNLLVNSNDPDEPVVTVQVQLIVGQGGEPDINVSPTSITINEPGASPFNLYEQNGHRDNFNINAEHVPGRLVVKFKEGVVIQEVTKSTSSISINQLNTQHNLNSIRKLISFNTRHQELKRQMGLLSIYILEFSNTTDLKSLIKLYESDPDIVYAEPDYYAYPDGNDNNSLIPNDPMYTDQWGLNNTGQAIPFGGGPPVGTPGADINAENAWNLQTGGTGITVAILDDGVDLSHTEFAGRLTPGFDFIDNDPDPSPVGNGAHGTACAGIAAAAGNNGVGVAGVAWGVMIMPVRVLGASGGTWTQIANGITWATDNGADVISMSLGGDQYSSTLENAINYAYNADVVVLASSGNGNRNNNTTPHYPSDLTNCISVGALSPCNDRKSPTTCDNENWWGSNYGGGLELMTPGVRIFTTDISGSAGYSTGDYTTDFNGTSSACPFAAGVAGLLRSENSSLTNSEIRSIMQSTAVDLGTAGYDDFTGYGRVDAYLALQAVSGGGSSSFTIFNVGTATLTVTSITDNKSWLLHSGYPTPPFDITPGASQLVSVSVDWNLISTQETGTITVASNDPDEPSVQVSVTAIPAGAPPPDINVIPVSWAYGNVPVGSSSSKTFEVQNFGGENLDVSSTTLTGTNAGEFSIDNGGAPFTVIPGGSHNVLVSFNPTSEGSKNCTFRIGSNDPDENPKDIPLTGTGITAGGIPLTPLPPLEAFPDENVVVNIDLGSTLDPVSNLQVISFDLLYTNTGIIDYSNSYQIGGFWGGNTPTVVVIPDDENGKISISMFILGGSQSGFGTIISLDFQVSTGAIGGQTIDWSFGTIAANNSNGDPIPIQPGTATTTIIEGLEVWPGDTDNNGTVQIIDINPIITRFGLTGPPCPAGGCNWIGRICPPWSPESDTYVDANGNGQIDITDINCVVVNHGNTHPVTSIPEVKPFGADPPLTGTSPSYMDPGEEYWVEITVGDATLPVTDMNVISFDLLFDNTQYIDYLGYEVGSFMSGATAIVIPDDQNGIISASLFSLTQGYSGHGVVMRFNFVVNPATPPSPEILISNSWGAVQANRVGGGEQPLDPQIFTYLIVPVELVSFNANIEKNNVFLSWETSSEINNSGFEIERMIDSDWEKIAFVKGNGTTTKEQYYQYRDDFKYTSVKGIVKYRLKQIDFNGTYEYSNIIEVNVDFTPNEYVLYQNYPNPFNPGTKIKYALPQSSKVNLTVYNTIGEVVSILVDGIQEEGFYEIDFDASILPSGMYFYRINTDSFVETKKMILMK